MKNQQTKTVKQPITVTSGVINSDIHGNKPVDNSTTSGGLRIESSGAYFKDKIEEIGKYIKTCPKEIDECNREILLELEAKLSILKEAQEQVKKVIDDYPNWFYDIDDTFFEKDYDEDELLDKLVNMLKEKLGI